jgi:replicative DNA helicase
VIGNEAEHTVAAGILQRPARIVELEGLVDLEHFTEKQPRGVFQVAIRYHRNRDGANSLDVALARSLLEQSDNKAARSLLPVVEEYAKLQPITEAEFRDAVERVRTAKRKALTKTRATEALEAALAGDDEAARALMRRGLAETGDVDNDRPLGIRSPDSFDEELRELKRPATAARSFDVGFRFVTDRSAIGVGRLAVIAGYAKDGKAIVFGTPVLTPAGWVPVEELREGDRVVGRNGKPTRVVGFFPQGVRPLLRVTFSDGVEIDADPDHLWAVKSDNDCSAAHARDEWRVLKTSELREKLGARGWRIPLCEPIEFEPVGELPIEPYTLGVLLGDGALGEGTPCFIPGDRSVPAQVALALEEDFVAARGPKLSVKEVGRKGSTGAIWSIARAEGGNAPNPITASLRELGLAGKRSWEKFVPGIYLRASVADRLALLQGLVDTDGCIGQGGRPSVVFASSSLALADAVAELARSLGGVARRRTRTETGYRDASGEVVPCRPSHEVCFCLPPGVVPTRAFPERWPRKLSKDLVRKIVSIEPREPAEAFCIAVDAPDRLFVAKDYIVTHNSQWAKTIAYNAMTRSGVRSLYTSLEMSKAEVRCLLVCAHAATIDPRGVPWAQVLDKTATREDRRLYARALLDLKVKEGAGDDADHVETKGGEGDVILWCPRRRPTVGEWCERLAILKREQGVTLGVADYLELFRPTRRTGEYRHDLTEMAYEFKDAAAGDPDRGEPGAGVVLLHQINRAGRVDAEKRSPRHYLMRDLKESSGIEAAATSIWWIFTDEVLKSDLQARAGVAANRMGESLIEGTEIHFNPRIGVVAELDDRSSG